MINERAIFNKLVNKKIWISEYMILRSTIIKTLKDIDTTYAAYTNIKNNNTFIVNGIVESIKGKKSRFFYQILRSKIFSRNITETHWSLIFNIPDTLKYFNDIYKRKIKSMPCTRLAEFNFKLLHKCLTCGYTGWDTFSVRFKPCSII